MIRPEVTALMRRYLEAIIGTLAALFGFYLLTRSFILWQGIGLLLIVVGCVIAVTSIRRLSLRSDSVGPGVVEVNERQISYFAPSLGGTISINQLVRISLVSAKGGAWSDEMQWLLEGEDGATLSIPNAATGTEKLYDAFSALPGVDYSAIKRALTGKPYDACVIWSKPRKALH